jgi:hypothetical protein
MTTEKFGENNIIDDSMCFQSILVGASKQETWSLITYVNQLIILIEELFSLFLLVLFFFVCFNFPLVIICFFVFLQENNI